MISTSTQKSHSVHARAGLFALVFVLLIPLIAVPGPSMVTGHPWKVELAVTGAVLAALTWMCLRSGLDIAEPLFASRRRTVALASILVFALWSAVSVFWAGAMTSVLHHTAVWLGYAAIFSLALLYLQKNRSLKTFVGAFGMVSVIVFGLCVFDYLTIPEFEHVEGTLRIRYAKYGEMFATIAPLLISLVFCQKSRSGKAIWMVAGGSAWLVVMLSLSKGAFIAGVAGFITVFAGGLLFGRLKIRRTVFTTAMIWLALTVVVQFFFVFYSSVPATAQYITGESDHNRQTSTFRLFTWKIGTSMALSNPVIGVGADNFGTSFNNARREYFADSAVNPDGSAVAEDFMVERAHNEFLQIFAELGLIGVFLFAFIVLAFAVPLYSRLREKRTLSPVLIGTAAGMSAFAVSSMFSSFSFRAMQNGVVFMLLLAIGIHELAKNEKRRSSTDGVRMPTVPVSGIKWLLPATALLCLLFHGIIGLSNFYTYFGQYEDDPALSRSYFDTAIKLNPENGAAHYLSGVREFHEKRPREALPRLDESRKFGAGATLNYYYTASSHLMNNDRENAVAALSEAVNIYPRSVYARVHYSVLLKGIGRKEEAGRQYAEAFRIDRRQAETWQLVLEDSLLNATDATRNRRDLDKPNELAPSNIIASIFHISRLDSVRE